MSELGGMQERSCPFACRRVDGEEKALANEANSGEDEAVPATETTGRACHRDRRAFPVAAACHARRATTTATRLHDELFLYKEPLSTLSSPRLPPLPLSGDENDLPRLF